MGFGLCLTISEARVRAARHTLMRRAMVLPHGDGVGPTVRLWASATRLRLRYNVHARRFHRLCAWAAVCNADFLLLASVSYRLALDPSGPAEVLQSTVGLTQVNHRSNYSSDRYIGEAEPAAPIPSGQNCLDCNRDASSRVNHRSWASTVQPLAAESPARIASRYQTLEARATQTLRV